MAKYKPTNYKERFLECCFNCKDMEKDSDYDGFYGYICCWWARQSARNSQTCYVSPLGVCDNWKKEGKEEDE